MNRIYKRVSEKILIILLILSENHLPLKQKSRRGIVRRGGFSLIVSFSP